MGRTSRTRSSPVTGSHDTPGDRCHMANNDNTLNAPGREAVIRLSLFGGLSLTHPDGSRAELPSQQSPALLAYLALNNRNAVSREAVLAIFWPDSEPDKARQNLRRCLHYLRNLLEKPPFASGGVLLATRTSIHLAPRAVWIDVVEFEAALDAASRTNDRTRRIDLLRRAAELYRGDLLPGFYQDGFMLERHRLAHRHLEGLLALVTELESAGALTEALTYARRAVQLDAFSDRARCSEMRINASLGRRVAAQRQRAELEAQFNEQVDAAPSADSAAFASRLSEQARSEAACGPKREAPRTASPAAYGNGHNEAPVIELPGASVHERPEVAMQGAAD